MERTSSGSGQNGPARGSEPLSSTAPVGQSAGIWRVVAGTIHARYGTFHLKWPEIVLFGGSDWTNGKWSSFRWCCTALDILDNLHFNWSTERLRVVN